MAVFSTLAAPCTNCAASDASACDCVSPPTQACMGKHIHGLYLLIHVVGRTCYRKGDSAKDHMHDTGEEIRSKKCEALLEKERQVRMVIPGSDPPVVERKSVDTPPTTTKRRLRSCLSCTKLKEHLESEHVRWRDTANEKHMEQKTSIRKRPHNKSLLCAEKPQCTHASEQ